MNPASIIFTPLSPIVDMDMPVRKTNLFSCSCYGFEESMNHVVWGKFFFSISKKGGYKQGCWLQCITTKRLTRTTQSDRQRQKGRKSSLLKEGHRVTFVSLRKQEKFMLKSVSFHSCQSPVCSLQNKNLNKTSLRNITFISILGKKF